MGQDRTRCRYLLPSNIQCERDALDPRFDVLLCNRHTADALELMRMGKRNNPDGSPVASTPVGDLAQRAEVSRDHGCVVYYVRFQDRIKIGTSRNVAVRLGSIPYDAVLGIEPGSYEVEKQRHLQFSHCHVTGEWFKGDDPKLLAHIRTLSKLPSSLLPLFRRTRV